MNQEVTPSNASLTKRFDEWLRLFRELIIIAVIVMLFISPATINRTLQQAGFTKASLAGWEWESRIRESQAKLQQAQQEVMAMEGELDQAKSELKIISRNQALPSDVKRRVNTLSENIQSSKSRASSIQSDLNKTIKKQDQILKKIEAVRP